MKHYYCERHEGILFAGLYEMEEDEDGRPPIITITSLHFTDGRAQGQDLLMIVDPRIIHELEAKLQSLHIN
jgi:hypothetical protein